jgi:hypothetical protein
MENTKTDNILKLLQKENETLKKIIKEKHIENESFQALLTILELQREQINYLEDGMFINYLSIENVMLQNTNEQLKEKMKDLQFKANAKSEPVYSSIFSSNNLMKSVTPSKPIIAEVGDLGDNLTNISNPSGYSIKNTNRSMVIDHHNNNYDRKDEHILSQSYKFPTGLQNVPIPT